MNRTIMNKIKEIPYSVSDFIEIIRSNMYYVDKTMYLPKLEEQPRNLFFIRPRRFGKSLWTFPVSSSRAQPRDLSCTAVRIT